MALTQRSRSALYHGLRELIGDDQAVEEMLSHFPARDDDEPISKEFLRAELSGVRAEMADLRGGLRGEMADLRGELRGEMADLRGELRAEMADLRGDMNAEIAALRIDMHDGFRRMTVAYFGSMISFAGILVGAAALLM